MDKFKELENRMRKEYMGVIDYRFMAHEKEAMEMGKRYAYMCIPIGLLVNTLLTVTLCTLILGNRGLG